MNTNGGSEKPLKNAPSDNLSKEDLIDQVAKRLPGDMRADYYRLLRHCRSLPENDELLRILNAMQYLTLLIVDVPGRVLVERERLEQLFQATLKFLDKALHSIEAYQGQLHEHLAKLPDKITQEVQPETIAAKINESLRQQFDRSTIPETAKGLASVAVGLENATAEFRTAARAIGNAYDGAAQEARRSITALAATSTQAMETIRREAEILSRQHWWAAYTLAGLGVVIGFVLGALSIWWIVEPAHPVDHATAPAIVQPHGVSRAQH